MKKITAVMVLAMIVFWDMALPAFAATVSSSPVPVSASVDGALSMTMTMKKNDFNGATVTSMDFGRLVDIGTGTLRSSSTSTTGTGAVDVFLSANSHGLPYTITQTGTALSNGSVNLPAGACVVTPVYAAPDNGGASMPPGAVLGPKESWVANNKVLYTSESGTAAMRTIEAFYSITDDPAAGSTASVPPNQPSGTYTGTVTFTVTA